MMILQGFFLIIRTALNILLKIESKVNIDPLSLK